MPQIDASTFVSQAFWLVLCFCTLWALLSLFIMPKLAYIKEQRKRKINEYLFKAEALKTQAQQAIDTYNKIIGDAQFAAEDSLTRGEAELAAHLQETAEVMKKKLSKKMAQQEAELAEEKTNTEKQIETVAQNLALNIVHKFGFSGITQADIAKISAKETAND